MWRDELSSLLEALFSEGSARMPVRLSQKVNAGNEEIAHWILVISGFLKSNYSEQEKCRFICESAGIELEILGTPPLVWIEDLRRYLLVNLKN